MCGSAALWRATGTARTAEVRRAHGPGRGQHQQRTPVVRHGTTGLLPIPPVSLRQYTARGVPSKWPCGASAADLASGSTKAPADHSRGRFSAGERPTLVVLMLDYSQWPTMN